MMGGMNPMMMGGGMNPMMGGGMNPMMGGGMNPMMGGGMNPMMGGMGGMGGFPGGGFGGSPLAGMFPFPMRIKLGSFAFTYPVLPVPMSASVVNFVPMMNPMMAASFPTNFGGAGDPAGTTASGPAVLDLTGVDLDAVRR